MLICMHALKCQYVYMSVQDLVEELKIASASSALDKEYMLPDGNTITVGSERFR